MEGNFSLEKSVPSVKLSVEALPESKIQEISYDGRETYYRPLGMSENLCKMATKIDFLAEEEGRSDEEEDDPENSKKSFQNQQWPWEGVRNHLRQALTEMSVLCDVLTITQSKGPPKKEGVATESGKYMMFDYAPKELPPAKLSMQLPAKKKGLNAAAEILFSGEKRLKNAGDETAPEMGFHVQLLKLRQYWRIRRVGPKIFGDLSYRTVGSDFWHAGNFEVIKKTTEDDDDTPMDPTFTHPQFFKNKMQSAFKVVVGADLNGSSTIRVSVRRKWDFTKDEILSCNIVEEGLVNPGDPQWHKTLCSAQNVLFCRELFNNLAKEAVQLKTNCTLSPFLVVGNKISTSIFPDTEFVIELVHNVPQDFHSEQKASQLGSHKKEVKTQSCDIFSLKFAAMKLLLDNHQKLYNLPAPHPTAAVYGLTKVQCKAPTRPYVLSQIRSVMEKEDVPLIERLVGMAKHWELKNRICEVIEVISDSIQDPYIQAHWSVVGNATETTMRTVIMSAGYEACNKTFVEMFVSTDSIKAVQKDGRVIILSSNFHHIRDYLLSLICNHQLSTTQEVFVISGWTVLHFSLHAGVGARSALGNVGSVMAVSPAGNCTVSVRCWLERGREDYCLEQVRYEVYTQNVRTDGDESNIMPQRGTHQNWSNSEQNAIQDSKWFLLGGEWREVDWAKLYGRHFIQKLESLITFLKSDG